MAENKSSPYDSSKFVNREEEIQQILLLLKQPQPRVRAVVIDGDRGAGKTWLSLHLHRTLLKTEIMGITSWLFSLWGSGDDNRPEGEKEQENERFVHQGDKIKLEDFLRIIEESLTIQLPPNAIFAEKVDAIRRYIQSHSDKRFVLILDSAYESDWSLLEQFETHLLGNLLTLNNFFVIITGRGRPYPWKVPYLIEAIRFGLGTFSVDQIKKQIEKFGLSSILSVNEIYEIGKGWPLFTEQLARAKNHTEALKIAADILFAVLPSIERGEIRAYFEALAALDGFGESEASLMVRTYTGAEHDGREICRKMNDSRLASWKNGRYEMNAPVLNVLRKYVPVSAKDKWIELHQAAYQHFAKNATDRAMERFRPHFEKLMETHANALSEAGITDLPGHLPNTTEEAKA